MYNIEFCHLGDDCAPGIIIDDILNQKIPNLFMLGFYDFNDIISYINSTSNNGYESIYEPEHLITNDKCSNHISHKIYNFTFNHDYKVIDDKIQNYKIIKERFDGKIINFKRMLSSDNKTIFVNFTHNIDKQNITGMIYWLSANKLSENYQILLFTDETYDDTKNHNYEYEKCTIIHLKNKYYNWWKMDRKTKLILYNEIYTKFIKSIENIEHNIPLTYNETSHYKANF